MARCFFSPPVSSSTEVTSKVKYGQVEQLKRRPTKAVRAMVWSPICKRNAGKGASCEEVSIPEVDVPGDWLDGRGSFY